jgi:hypothetical protein
MMDNERIKELRDEGHSWTEIGKIEARTTHADPRTEGVRLRSQYRRAYEPPYKRKNRQGRREEVAGNEESQSGAPVAENNTGHTTQDTVQDTTQANGTVIREKTARLSNQQYTSEKTYSSPNTKPSSPEELLASHGYDPSKWTIVESTYSSSPGRYTSRIKVKPALFQDNDEATLMASVSRALELLPPIMEHHRAPYRFSDGDLQYERTAVLPLYDLHFGRQYALNGTIIDHLDLAASLVPMITQFIEHAHSSKATNVIIVVGQDFLNSDTILGTTTKGTPQRNSLPWHEAFAQGLVLLADIIDRVSEHFSTKVVYSEGNHDTVLSFCLAKALEQRYRLSTQVKVDASISPRKYETVAGSTLLGFIHDPNHPKLSSLMQTDVPEMWGQTSRRYWITGHVHSLGISSGSGYAVITCPSPAIMDEWTEDSGYDYQPAMCGFLFSALGLEEMWQLNSMLA